MKRDDVVIYGENVSLANTMVHRPSLKRLADEKYILFRILVEESKTGRKRKSHSEGSYMSVANDPREVFEIFDIYVTTTPTVRPVFCHCCTG